MSAAGVTPPREFTEEDRLRVHEFIAKHLARPLKVRRLPPPPDRLTRA